MRNTGAAPGRGATKPRRARTRFQELNAFVDLGMADLSRAEIAVWLILFRDTQPDGIASVSSDDLARRSGVTRRTVIRALKRLAARRMLRVVRRGGLGRGPSTYAIFPYAMEPCR